MTTPDPTGNGSREPQDRSGTEPADERTSHPSGMPAEEPTSHPSSVPADEPTSHPSGVPADGSPPGGSYPGPVGAPLTLASPEDPGGLIDQPPDTAVYPPIPAMPVEPPPTLGDHAAGSSPDEMPTAAQPAVAAPPPSDPEPAGGRLGGPADGELGPPADGEPAASGRPAGGVPPPKPPAWSTPDTPTVAPPLAGTPPPPPPGPPNPPTYGPAPGGRPNPRLNRRALALIVGLTAALLACCCASVVGGAIAWGDGLYDQLLNRGHRTVGLHETARDGNLEFQVAGVQCSVPRVGDQYVSQVAVGQFCLVDVTIRNAGDRPATFDDSLQRGYGPGDRQFGVDQTAGMIVNAAQPLFLAPINPGNQVSAVLVFDIPADARLSRLLLRSAADSRGVLVRV